MLSAVGQNDREVVDEVSVAGESHSETDGRSTALNLVMSTTPSAAGRTSARLTTCGPIMTPMIGGQLESLSDHLQEGRKRVVRVKQGHGLFGEIQEEERKRLELSQEAAKKEQEQRRSDWNQLTDYLISFNSSDDDLDDNHDVEGGNGDDLCNDYEDDNENGKSRGYSTHQALSTTTSACIPSRNQSTIACSVGVSASYVQANQGAFANGSQFSDGEQDFSDDSDQTENDHEDEPEMESNDSNTGGVNEMLALANHSRSAGQNGPLAVRRRSKVHNTGSMQLFQTSHSSFGTNATSESGNFETVYRYLRSLQWILEAMIQKSSGGSMPPIMSTWQTRADILKKNDGREILETRRQREQLWEKLIASEPQKKSLFLRPPVKPTKSISPASSSTSFGCRYRSTSNEPAGSMILKHSSSVLDTRTGMLPDDERDAVYEATVALVTSGVLPSDICDDSININEDTPPAIKQSPCQQPLKGALKKLPKTLNLGKQHAASSLKPPSIVPRMTRGVLLRHPSLRRTFPPTRPHQPKPRPKSSPPTQRKLTAKQYEELVKLVEKPDYVHRRALAAVRKAEREASVTGRKSSNGNLPSNVPQIVPCSFSPVDTRNEFDSVLKDKELIVHEQLSAIQRDRYQTCRQKFMTLNCMRGTGKLWDDLQTIRADVATETASMARRKLLMNYYWYHDLVMDLPPGIKHDRLFADVLHRLQELSKAFTVLGPYKLSRTRLLRVLATLRSWERESPEIKRAIDFMRVHVIYVSTDEYEMFMAEHEAAVSGDRRPKSAALGLLKKSPI
jgi:hypothetical protein